MPNRRRERRKARENSRNRFEKPDAQQAFEGKEPFLHSFF